MAHLELDKKYLKKINFKSLDLNVDNVLEDICKYPRGSYMKNFIKIKSPEDFPKNPEDIIIEYMIQEDLIERHQKVLFKVTKLGYDIHREGGWVKHLENIKNDNLEIKKREEREKENLRWSTKVSKFQVRTKWWPYIISFLSLCIAAFALYISLTSP